MKHLTRGLILSALLFSSCITSETDLDRLPKAALSSLTFKVFENPETLNGVLVYEGGYSNPSKITILWSGGLRMFQIPITDDVHRIERTVYEYNNGRIVRITNTNNLGVDARIETFTYVDGFLTRHTLREINAGGQGHITYTNDFTFDKHYDPDKNHVGGGLVAVNMLRCDANNTCVTGFLGRFDEFSLVSAIPTFPAENEAGWDYADGDLSTFTKEACDLSRANGRTGYFTFSIPDQFEDFGFFNLPRRIGDVGSEYFSTFKVDEGNAEYMWNLYYELGKWIHPAYMMQQQYNNENDVTMEGDLYGTGNTSWIFPRLWMPVAYDEYSEAFTGFDLAREFEIMLTSKIVE